MNQHSLASALAADAGAPVDGRQSETALAIARGTMRMARLLGMACLPEIALPSGRRADLVAFDQRGAVWIVEIKSSVEDFRTDRKWSEYRAHCDHLFFAVDARFPRDILPEDTGIILADRYGAQILREAPHHALPAATRRSMALKLARTAALRLHGLCDPEAAAPGEMM